MSNKVLTTHVDTLMQELKTHKILSFDQLQKKLNIPLMIIERWIVILEEYKVIKTSYKGLQGFVQIVEKKEEKGREIEDIKAVFIEKSKNKKLTFEQMREIWPKFLTDYKDTIKKEFETKAMKKGYDKNKIALAWSKFQKELEKF